MQARAIADPGRRAFWSRPGLEVVAGRLRIAGRDAETLARMSSTPLYVFDLQRIGEQIRGLQAQPGRGPRQARSPVPQWRPRAAGKLSVIAADYPIRIRRRDKPDYSR